MSKEWIKSLKAGDTVFLIERWRSGGKTFTVTAVGRRWISFSGTCLRVDRHTGLMDSFSYYSELHQSERHYLEKKELAVRRRSLLNLLSASPETLLTHETMDQIEQVLGLPTTRATQAHHKKEAT